jgi:hypothetical protein
MVADCVLHAAAAVMTRCQTARWSVISVRHWGALIRWRRGRPKVLSDVAEGKQEPLCLPRRGEVFITQIKIGSFGRFVRAAIAGLSSAAMSAGCRWVKHGWWLPLSLGLIAFGLALAVLLIQIPALRDLHWWSTTLQLVGAIVALIGFSSAY